MIAAAASWEPLIPLTLTQLRRLTDSDHNQEPPSPRWPTIQFVPDVENRLRIPRTDVLPEKPHAESVTKKVTSEWYVGAKYQELLWERLNAFLGAIADTDSSEPWTVTLFLNDRQLLFKIDTGADVTAIPETTYIKSREMDHFTRQPES